MVKFKLVSENTPNMQEILNEYFPSHTSTEDNFFVKRIEREDCRITIYITEEYYFRINSDLTLTVIVEETKNETIVEVVCSGGKEGLLGFSHGAEEKAADDIVRLLKANGFKERLYEC